MLVVKIPQEPIFFRFRIDPEMRRFLDRLRDEKDINVSAWARRVFRDALHLMFPEAAATTETPEAEPEAEPEPPRLQKPNPQPATTETPEAEAEQLPPLEISEVQEPDPQKPPIKGWKPRKLPSGEWGAALEGEMVAELPDNDQLPGTPIRVTDKKGESWTTTLTEVIDKTDTNIVVTNSGRPRS